MGKWLGLVALFFEMFYNFGRFLKGDLMMSGFKPGDQEIVEARKAFKGDIRILDLKDCRVFVFQQKVPRDGHGPVVIIAENFPAAAGQLLKRFKKKYPKVTEEESGRFFANYSWRSSALKPGIVLDYHGI